MTRASVSVQLYSVREAIARDLEGALARIAGIGFTATEPYGFVPHPVHGPGIDAGRLRQALDAAGLTAPSGHAPVLQLDDPRIAFDAASTLGVRTLIDPFHAPEEWGTADDVARIAERINRTAALATEAGLVFGYHNHWFELEGRVDGVPALEALAAQLDPAVILEVDSYWVEVGGVSAPDLLARLGDRVRLIHVKDGPKTRDTKAQVAVGTGLMDVPAVLAAAPHAVRVIEFDDTEGDVFDGLTASLAYVTATDAAAGE